MKKENKLTMVNVPPRPDFINKHGDVIYAIKKIFKKNGLEKIYKLIHGRINCDFKIRSEEWNNGSFNYTIHLEEKYLDKILDIFKDIYVNPIQSNERMWFFQKDTIPLLPVTLIELKKGQIEIDVSSRDNN